MSESVRARVIFRYATHLEDHKEAIVKYDKNL